MFVCVSVLSSNFKNQELSSSIEKTKHGGCVYREAFCLFDKDGDGTYQTHLSILFCYALDLLFFFFRFVLPLFICLYIYIYMLMLY